MNTSVDSSDVPVGLAGSNLNLSLNLTGLNKKNSAHNIGIPLPLGLIPQKPAVVRLYFICMYFWKKVSF